MYFEEDGVYFYDFMKDKPLAADELEGEGLGQELERAGKFQYSLESIEIQKVPKNPRLHKKIYKGMLGWYKVRGIHFTLFFWYCWERG